jgi:hypothetical protein
MRRFPEGGNPLEKQNPEIHPPIRITDCMVAADGGTVWFALQDADRKTHTLWIPQHNIAENFSPGYPPGSLVLDGIPLKPRGREEQQLTEWLRTAAIRPARANSKGIDIHNREITLPPYTEEEAEKMSSFIRDMISDILAFVKSDAYPALAKKYGK